VKVRTYIWHAFLYSILVLSTCSFPFQKCTGTGPKRKVALAVAAERDPRKSLVKSAYIKIGQDRRREEALYDLVIMAYGEYFVRSHPWSSRTKKNLRANAIILARGLVLKDHKKLEGQWHYSCERPGSLTGQSGSRSHHADCSFQRQWTICLRIYYRRTRNSRGQQRHFV
jgi:hypothetical protein